MKNFRYKAYDPSGMLKQGELQAVSPESAKFKLKEDGLIPVSISDAQKGWAPLKEQLTIETRPKTADIEELTNRLALLLKNGIRVDRAIEFALKGIRNRRLGKIMDTVHSDIRKGDRLSDTLAKFPEVFGTLYISIVRVGEQSGELAQSFDYIASNLAFHKTILAKTRQAMLYPLVILLVCLGAVLFVFNVVIPRFSSIFEGMENLPGYTQLLLAASDFFVKYQLVIFPALAAALIGLWWMRDHERVKGVQHTLAARVPVVRSLTNTLENLRFASALAMLLASGVVLSDALEHAVDAVSNRHIKKRLLSVKPRIRQGEKLSETLEAVGFLPDAFDGLVEVGEQTGNLTEVFREMEARLRADYENRVASLITLIEPIMIVVMGLIVGSIVVALLLSIVSVNDLVF